MGMIYLMAYILHLISFISTLNKKRKTRLDSKPIGQINKDETARIAEEAGFYGFDGDNNKRLLEFANKVAAAEREACAKLCEEMASWHSELVTAAYETAADAIRARGQG